MNMILPINKDMQIPNFNLLRGLLFLIAGLILCSSISGKCVAQEKQSQTNREILINVTITNSKGNYITRLDQGLFALFEGKTFPKILSFQNNDTPASIALVLDTSVSMRLGESQISVPPEMLAGLVSGFIKQSNKENDYFLLGFNERPQVLSDWTQSEKAITDTVASLKWKSLTALYDACYFGVEKLAQAKNQKRVLFIITDGVGDSASKHGPKDLEQLLMKNPDILVYSIALPSGALNQTVAGAIGGESLSKLSEISGGKAFFTNKIKELTHAFELMALELRNQYLIGFKSPEDGKEHQIKIKLKLPDDVPGPLRKISIRSREKYLALKN